jgi:hypothetical protein
MSTIRYYVKKAPFTSGGAIESPYYLFSLTSSGEALNSETVDLDLVTINLE